MYTCFLKDSWNVAICGQKHYLQYARENEMNRKILKDTFCKFRDNFIVHIQIHIGFEGMHKDVKP